MGAGMEGHIHKAKPRYLGAINKPINLENFSNHHLNVLYHVSKNLSVLPHEPG